MLNMANCKYFAIHTTNWTRMLLSTSNRYASGIKIGFLNIKIKAIWNKKLAVLLWQYWLYDPSKQSSFRLADYFQKFHDKMKLKPNVPSFW